MTSAPESVQMPIDPPTAGAGRRIQLPAAALAGVASAALALGLSELLAGLLPGATSLVAAVGQVVIDLQPPGAKDFVVELFGTNDKVALEAFVAVVALGIGAVFGIAATRSFAVAAGGFAVLGVVGFIAALGDPLANPGVVALQLAVSVLVGIRTLGWLLSRAPASRPPETRSAGPSSDPARRSFLLQTGAVGLGAIVAGFAGRSLISGARDAPPSVAGYIPPPLDLAPDLAPGTDLSPSVAGLTPIVMPNEAFYRIDTALLSPTVDIDEWRLRIHGMVDHDTTLTWQQLLELPQFEQYVTIACVSNSVGGRLVGNAKWTGVRLRDVLDMAGVRPEATQLVGRSIDGWTAGMPTAWVMDPAREPMIAIKMNDEPLPQAHGSPARLIVPGLYGYVSATKWLSELELTTLEAFDGYWIPLGWAKEAPILTQSRIDTPKRAVKVGRVPIAGIAWAPDRGISRVEVGIDDVWRDAELSRPISDATWVQWVHQWDATPGDHRIQVRATDGDGVVQEERRTTPAPDGARGWDVVTINVG
jgi:DMSO/TMAO reductase YedYZ molybdopterin-dependent catalytic subunit